MSRRLFAFGLMSALIAAQFGCHTSRCGWRPGWFTSNKNGEVPCQTVGQNGGCYDAVTGQPVPCPPDTPGTLLPGGGPLIPGVGPRLDELHMPAPLIPAPAVPFPAPAPSSDASLPFPTSPGTPVKFGSNK